MVVLAHSHDAAILVEDGGHHFAQYVHHHQSQQQAENATLAVGGSSSSSAPANPRLPCHLHREPSAERNSHASGDLALGRFERLKRAEGSQHKQLNASAVDPRNVAGGSCNREF